MQRLNLIVGESINWDFTLTDSNGNAIDLADYDDIQAHLYLADTSPAISLDLDSGISKSDTPTDGVITLEELDTTDLEPGQYFLEIGYQHTTTGVITKPSKVIVNVLYGSITAWS